MKYPLKLPSVVYTDSNPKIARGDQTHTFTHFSNEYAIVVGPCEHSVALRTLAWLGTNKRP